MRVGDAQTCSRSAHSNDDLAIVERMSTPARTYRLLSTCPATLSPDTPGRCSKPPVYETLVLLIDGGNETVQVQKQAT